MLISHGVPRKQILDVVEVTDPAELERDRRRREQFDRNFAWHQAHLAEIYRDENRGKYFCIAGEELFLSESYKEAIAMAARAHSEDEGPFFRRVSPDFDKPIKKIYAMQW